MHRKKFSCYLRNPFIFRQKLLSWLKSQPIFLALNSNGYRNDAYSKYDFITAVGALEIFKSSENIFKEIATLDRQNDWLFGHFSYDLKNEIHSFTSTNTENIAFPLVHFFVPKYVFFIENNTLKIHYPKRENEESIKKIVDKINTVKLSVPKINEECDIKCSVSARQYKNIVNKLKQHIHQGDIYEINYCIEFYAKNLGLDPFELCQKLWQRTQMPFSAFYRLNEKFLISASPERFLQKSGSQLITQPIKGTIKKSSIFFVNLCLKHQLKTDKKEISENVMIVDLARNDLTKIARKNSVKVCELCKVYSFKHLYQLISTVACTLRSKVGLGEIIKATFPMGSMTGAPKINAMKLIEKYENMKRGLFSGTVGYITPEKDFDFNVVIRSILYDREANYLSFPVGSAITAKSVAEKEYQECLLKVKNIRDILGT